MNIDDILFWSESLPELENSLDMKKAIGTALIGIAMMDDPGKAIESICEVILKKFRENILPAPEFIKYPPNRVSAYDSDADWLAAYMIYAIKKADNITAISHEIDKGHTSVVKVICPDDLGVCRGCDMHGKSQVKLNDIKYEDIPPYHFGCRCSMLFMK